MVAICHNDRHKNSLCGDEDIYINVKARGDLFISTVALHISKDIWPDNSLMSAVVDLQYVRDFLDDHIETKDEYVKLLDESVLESLIPPFGQVEEPDVPHEMLAFLGARGRASAIQDGVKSV